MHEDALEFCESWLDALIVLADIETQKRAWFQHIGELVSSYDDEIEELFRNSKELEKEENRNLLNEECREHINAVVALVKSYEKSPDFLLNASVAERLFNDPKWLEIVKAAEEAYAVLLIQKKELESHDE